MEELYPRKQKYEYRYMMLDDAQTNQSPRYLIKCTYQFMTQGRMLYTKEAADESKLADIKMYINHVGLTQ